MTLQIITLLCVSQYKIGKDTMVMKDHETSPRMETAAMVTTIEIIHRPIEEAEVVSIIIEEMTITIMLGSLHHVNIRATNLRI